MELAAIEATLAGNEGQPQRPQGTCILPDGRLSLGRTLYLIFQIYLSRCMQIFITSYRSGSIQYISFISCLHRWEKSVLWPTPPPAPVSSEMSYKGLSNMYNKMGGIHLQLSQEEEPEGLPSRTCKSHTPWAQAALPTGGAKSREGTSPMGSILRFYCTISTDLFIGLISLIYWTGWTVSYDVCSGWRTNGHHIGCSEAVGSIMCPIGYW